MNKYDSYEETIFHPYLDLYGRSCTGSGDTQKLDWRVPAQGAKDIPATIDLLTKDSLKISIKTLNATYVARSVKGELEGTFTQNGFKLPLNMKETSPDGPNRPQTPKPPFPYDTEEVTFTNDKAGATLAEPR